MYHNMQQQHNIMRAGALFFLIYFFFCKFLFNCRITPIKNLKFCGCIFRKMWGVLLRLVSFVAFLLNFFTIFSVVCPLQSKKNWPVICYKCFPKLNMKIFVLWENIHFFALFQIFYGFWKIRSVNSFIYKLKT